MVSDLSGCGLCFLTDGAQCVSSVVFKVGYQGYEKICDGAGPGDDQLPLYPV